MGGVAGPGSGGGLHLDADHPTSPNARSSYILPRDLTDDYR